MTRARYPIFLIRCAPDANIAAGFLVRRSSFVDNREVCAVGVWLPIAGSPDGRKKGVEKSIQLHIKDM